MTPFLRAGLWLFAVLFSWAGGYAAAASGAPLATASPSASPLASPASSPTATLAPTPPPTASPAASAHPSTLPSPSPAATGPETVARIDGDTVYFSGHARPLKTGLTDLKFIGTIHSAEGEAFHFLAGRSCAAASCPVNLYAFPSDTHGAKQPKPVTFVYPGEIVDTRKHQVVFKGRAFLGKCLPNSAMRDHDYYVVFQEERIDRRNRFQPSVFVAQPASPYWIERLISMRANQLPRLKDTLKMVHAKTCREIEGKTRNSIRKPFEIKLPPALEEEEEEDRGDAEDEAPAAP